MPSVTAQDFINLEHIDDSTTDMEYVLDLAIDTLNLHGATTISNMAGGPPKTVTLTSKQRGAVFHIAHAVYHDYFKERATGSIDGVTITAMDLLSNPTYVRMLEKMAKRLRTVTFRVGTDTSGLG